MPADTSVATLVSGVQVEPPASRMLAPDQGTIFLTYLSFMGDRDKVAAALHISPGLVVELETSQGWRTKIESLQALKLEKGADALARELNRVMNFVQSARLRALVDRAIRSVTETDRAFEDFMTNHGKHTSNTTCRAIADLVKAAQTVHEMTYASLGDTATERKHAADDPGSGVSGVLAALSRLSAGALPAVSPSSDPVLAPLALPAPASAAGEGL